MSSITATDAQLQELVEAAREVESTRGIPADDLLAVMSFETAGTLDPWKRGPYTQHGRHRGLIQWGEPQARQYGVTRNTSIRDQVFAAADYLEDRGYRPGMGIENMYAAVLAGDAKRTGVGDLHNGGVAKSAAHATRTQFGPHTAAANDLLNRFGSSQISRQPTPSSDFNPQELAFVAPPTPASPNQLGIVGQTYASIPSPIPSPRAGDQIARQIRSWSPSNTALASAPRTTQSSSPSPQPVAQVRSQPSPQFTPSTVQPAPRSQGIVSHNPGPILGPSSGGSTAPSMAPTISPSIGPTLQPVSATSTLRPVSAATSVAPVPQQAPQQYRTVTRRVPNPAYRAPVTPAPVGPSSGAPPQATPLTSYFSDMTGADYVKPSAPVPAPAPNVPQYINQTVRVPITPPKPAPIAPTPIAPPTPAPSYVGPGGFSRSFNQSDEGQSTGNIWTDTPSSPEYWSDVGGPIMPNYRAYELQQSRQGNTSGGGFGGSIADAISSLFGGGSSGGSSSAYVSTRSRDSSAVIY